jgi:hypothetical protein
MPVVAFGLIESTTDTYAVTVREPAEQQVDVEIVSGRGGEIPDHYEEKRRWTYSQWTPGSASPASGERLREIPLGGGHVLAISVSELRLWVFDGVSQIVHLLPVTNFYNEVMLLMGQRDPAIALQSSRLFTDNVLYDDALLRGAFRAYNRGWKRLDLSPEDDPAVQKGLFERLFGRKSTS